MTFTYVNRFSVLSLFLFLSCFTCSSPSEPNLGETLHAGTWSSPDTSRPVHTAFSPDTLLDLPPRPADAPTGTELITILTPLDLQERETRIAQEVLQGNVPSFLRTLVPVTFETQVNGNQHRVTFWCTPEYMALGSDADYFLMPLTPILAQILADSLSCILPTRRMVNLIWSAAPVKLSPQPIPPTPEMVTVPVFADHDSMVYEQRAPWLDTQPLGSLVAGHKKDVIMSKQVFNNPGKVVIYGWHYLSGVPIQPTYSGHVIWYADYSHGIRMVRDSCRVDGKGRSIRAILKDPDQFRLLSDESVELQSTRYDTDASQYP